MVCFGVIFDGKTLVNSTGKFTIQAVQVDVVFRPDKAEPYESLRLREKNTVMEGPGTGTSDETWKTHGKNHGIQYIYNI